MGKYNAATTRYADARNGERAGQSWTLDCGVPWGQSILYRRGDGVAGRPDVRLRELRTRLVASSISTREAGYYHCIVEAV